MREEKERKVGRWWGERKEIILVCSIKYVIDLTLQLLYKKLAQDQVSVYLLFQMD